MTHMYVYQGALDASGKVLTLDTEGPCGIPGKTAKLQDIIEIKSNDERLMRSRMLGDDGQWTQFMTARYCGRRNGRLPRDGRSTRLRSRSVSR